MAVSGARGDPDRLNRFCDDTDHGMSDCAFLAHFGTDLHSIDLSPAAQDLTDQRIRMAVVIDLGIVNTRTAQSLAQIDITMLVISLGHAETVPAGVMQKTAQRRSLRRATAQ